MGRIYCDETWFFKRGDFNEWIATIAINLGSLNMEILTNG